MKFSSTVITVGLVFEVIVLKCANSSCFVKKRFKETRIPKGLIPKTATCVEIKNSKIAKIEPEDLAEWGNVTELILKGNDLTEFPNFTYIADTLLVLDIRTNNISEIVTERLKLLTVIQKISIGHNEITNFTNIRVLKDTLRVFNTRGNPIDLSTLKPEIFDGFSSLIELELASIELTVFPDLSYLKGNLKILKLKLNYISYISPERLDILTKLERLELQQNRLHSFPDVAGPGLTLRSLNLNSNQFDKFPLLSNIGSNLEHLLLFDNNMSVIPPENFVFQNRQNRSIDFNLDLNDNSLTSLPLPVGSNLTNLIVHIERNPLECDIRLVWMLWMPRLDQMTGECVLKGQNGTVSLKNVTFENLGVKPVKDIQPKRKIKLVRSAIGVYNNMMPMLKTSASSSIQCMERCMSSPGCVYVNYNKHTRNCHYSSPLYGQIQQEENFDGWTHYSVMY